MPRKGRFLEILAGRLHEFLEPEGIIIESPKVFYRDGKKIGEIDVALRGDFKSSKVFVGIECRDRPSDGPQGREWIREIRGKQIDLGIDKMIAISSTGFTEPATRLANSWGIDLLTIEDIDEVDLQDWFKSLDLIWTEFSPEIAGGVHLTTIPRIPMKPCRGPLFLESKVTNKLVPLEKYIQPEVDKLVVSLQEKPGVAQEIVTKLKINGPIDGVIGGRRFKIAGVTVPIRVRCEVVRIKALTNVCRRLSDHRIIALTGVSRIKTKCRELKVLIIVKKNRTDGSLFDLRCSFLTEDNKPYKIPAGTKISLFRQRTIPQR
jgi:hypothetical protein